MAAESTARNAFWKIVDAARLRYPTMHWLATADEMLGRGDRRGRYRAEQPFQIYEMVRRSPRNGRHGHHGKTKVLMANIRGSAPLVTSFEGLIAHALRMRGAEVSSIACDGNLKRCDGYLVRNFNEERCARCAGTCRTYLEAFGVPTVRLGDLVRPADWEYAKEIAFDTPSDRLADVTCDGVPVGERARFSACYNLCVDRLPDTDASIQVLREFVETGVVLVRAYRRLLDAVEPDAIVMLNGLYMMFRILVDLAQQRDLPVYTYERSYRRDSWVFAKDRWASHHPVEDAWEVLKDVPLTAEQNALLDAYCASREAGALDDVLPVNVDPEERSAVIWQQLALDPLKPTAALFPNDFADSTTLEYRAAFGSIHEWIDQTVTWFERHPDHQLILRAHPAELVRKGAPDTLLTSLQRRGRELPPNVAYVPPESKISSYRLMELSRVNLVFLSTIGLEAVLKGRSSILAGKVWYAARGFTNDVANPAEYQALLDRFTELDPPTPAQVEAARRFAYLGFFRYPFIFPWFNELPGSWAFSDLKMDSLDALAPGRDHRLDELCAAILARQNIPLGE